MIYSNNLFEMLDSAIGHKGKQKVTVIFQKKLLKWQMGNLNQIAPNLCNFISHDSLYRYL